MCFSPSSVQSDIRHMFDFISSPIHYYFVFCLQQQTDAGEGQFFFFFLLIDKDINQSIKWFLIYSINIAAPNGGILRQFH